MTQSWDPDSPEPAPGDGRLWRLRVEAMNQLASRRRILRHARTAVQAVIGAVFILGTWVPQLASRHEGASTRAPSLHAAFVGFAQHLSAPPSRPVRTAEFASFRAATATAEELLSEPLPADAVPAPGTVRIPVLAYTRQRILAFQNAVMGGIATGSEMPMELQDVPDDQEPGLSDPVSLAKVRQATGPE